ncbi:hypothetical protein ABZS84_16030 [Streptomyces sp. NPDC005481]|uniref:hypothetical protein n=1 Tax=Streptomyces sp. NPDC005481 TaxID=3154881 RepID=UPI0033A51221
MTVPHTPDPLAAWRRALTEADRIFAATPPLEAPVDGCTHCYPESELHLLGGDPDAVPDDLLGCFMREVPSHWDPDQYSVLWRRLMPRALRHWGPDGEAVDPAAEIGHLGADGAGFAHWPEPERAVTLRAFGALLGIALTDGGAAGDITGLLEGIAHATGDLDPWLAHISGLSGPGTDAGLVRLAFDWATDLLWDEFRFSWWYDGDPRTIATWLPAQRPRVAAFAAAHPGCKTAKDTLAALDALTADDHSPWLYPRAFDRCLRLLPQPDARDLAGNAP